MTCPISRAVAQRALLYPRVATRGYYRLRHRFVIIDLVPWWAYRAVASSIGRVSIFAARMKSLSDRPPIECVQVSIQRLR